MPTTLLVSAAASLSNVMGEVGKAFQKQNGNITLRFNFAGSGVLQKQIENGAPADVFVSASVKEMDALQSRALIETASRVRVASNRLVLIAPVGSRLTKWQELASDAVRRIALADPDTVPAGRYAREVLTRRKLWHAVNRKSTRAQNVRQALSYVASGDADAGIVFATDARQESKRVRVVAVAAPNETAPILYPAAVVSQSVCPDAARRFVRFLKSPEARRVFRSFGFLP